MSRYTITPAAKKDIKEIKDFIVSNNQEAARIFISELTLKFQTLADFPEMGRLWDELVPPLRSFPIGRYLIFYPLTMVFKSCAWLVATVSWMLFFQSAMIPECKNF